MSAVALDPALELALRGSVALLFLVAAVHKIRGFAGFQATLADYRLLPRALVAPAAVGLVALELALVAALVLPGLREVGGIGAAALLLLYAVAMAINLARGRRHIDCGCLGPAARQSLAEWLVLRNALVAAAALGCLLPVGARPLVCVDAVTVAGAIAVLAGIYTSVHLLMANAPELAQLRS